MVFEIWDMVYNNNDGFWKSILSIFGDDFLNDEMIFQINVLNQHL